MARNFYIGCYGISDLNRQDFVSTDGLYHAGKFGVSDASGYGFIGTVLKNNKSFKNIEILDYRDFSEFFDRINRPFVIFKTLGKENELSTINTAIVDFCQRINIPSENVKIQPLLSDKTDIQIIFRNKNFYDSVGKIVKIGCSNKETGGIIANNISSSLDCETIVFPSVKELDINLL